MTTAIAEAPASHSTAPELGLFTFDNGRCINPEEVTLRDMPKGHELHLHVAQAPSGLWHSGYRFAIEKTQEGGRLEVDVSDEGYASRSLALIAGLKATAVHFEKSKKATAAIEALYDKLKAEAEGAAISAAPAVEVEALTEPLPKGKFAEIPVAAIAPNPENHRKHHDAIKAKELADSIKQAGLLQPIAVRLLGAHELGEMPIEGEGVEAKRYEIILGERRWRAHVTLGLAVIEAKVYEGVTRSDAKAAALIENLQREDVNPIEEAEGYADLMKAKGYTQEQCAQRVGRSRAGVANALRVLEVPAVTDLIREGKLTMAHGMAFHKYAARPEIVRVMAEQAVHEKTSAGQLEEWNKRDYVPFSNVLRQAGLISVIHRSDLPNGWQSEWPEAWAADADYQQIDDYQWLCWAPAKAREFMEAWKAEVAAERAKAEEKAAKDRKKAGVKSLEDLDRRQYTRIESQADIEALLPESKVLTIKESTEKDARVVAVCTAPKFATAVREAYFAAERADCEAKLPALLAEARAKVKKWKKLGADEMALVMAVLLNSEDSACMLSPAAAKSQGVALPAALKLPHYDEGDGRLPEDLGKAIKALAADPVGYARVLVDDHLVSMFTKTWNWERLTEPEEWSFGEVGDSERAILSAILDKPLGLLGDTAAGRRKLVAQVKALPWYAAAYEKASKAGEDMGDISEVTTDPKILAEWVKASANGMGAAEIARSYGVSIKDVEGALAGRADAKEDGDNE